MEQLHPSADFPEAPLASGPHPAPVSADPPPEDTFKILLATDNHLGAYEKHRHRRHDSFVTFEEILQLAVREKVDFILLGGDLFHDNKPSHATLQRTMELFRTYCMGNRPINFAVVSDPAQTLEGGFERANFEDPNYNVACPVFMVHGNHDDPTGERSISPIHLLAAANLVNYFGKSGTCDDIQIRPILLQKGKTKLALYGLGHIRDERLHRSFEQKKVHFLRPSERPQEWFSLFAIHQNRELKGPTRNAIPQEMLKGFVDLVFWGHEHEARPVEKVQQGDRAFDVFQGGSSIATALSNAEAVPKQVAILEVNGTRYRLRTERLRSVRPFFIEDVSLADEQLDKTTVDVTEFLATKVRSLVQRCKETVRFDAQILKRNPSLPLPLIRLRVDFSGGYPTINPQSFGSQFIDEVANSNELFIPIKYVKKASGSGATKKESDSVRRGLGFTHTSRGEEAVALRVEDMVLAFLKDKQGLELLEERGLSEAISTYVQKEEAQAIQDHVKDRLSSTQKRVWKESKARMGTFGQEAVTELVTKIKEENRVKQEREEPEPRRPATALPEPADDMPPSPKRARSVVDSGDELEPVAPAPSTPAPPAKRGRGKTPAGTGRGRGRGRATSSIEVKEEPETEPRRKKPRDDASQRNRPQLRVECSSSVGSQQPVPARHEVDNILSKWSRM